eukprot:gene10846-22635_t
MNVLEIVDLGILKSGIELFVSACVAKIEPKEASSVLQLLSVELPLQQFGLNHLKRVRKSHSLDQVSVLEVLICPQSYFDSISPEIASRFSSVRNVEVVRFQPQTREEFEAWGQGWPTTYRPTELDRVRAKGLDAVELQYLSTYTEALKSDVLDVARIHHSVNREVLNMTVNGTHAIGGGVLVNPELGQVVMTSSRSLELAISQFGSGALQHPLHSPTLLCVDGVAALIRKMEDDDEDEVDNGERDRNTDPGVSLKEDQYLCTGLDLVLSREPDLVDSMALVHSRIRRVFYLETDPDNGTLGSVACLHSLRALNHRFRVFWVRLTDPETTR